MFHTFLHPISRLSGEAWTSVGIALPPMTVTITPAIDFDQQSSSRVPPAHGPPLASATITSTPLEDWLDNLPVRDWDA